MKDIRELADRYLRYCANQRGLTKNTIRNYGFDLNFFIKFLNNNDHPPDCSAVTKHLLEDYLGSMTDKYKVKTVRRKLACIRSFYTYLEDQELIMDNPFHKFKLKLKEGYRKPKSMTMTEMDRFLKVAYDNELAEEIYPLIKKIKRSEIKQLDTMSREFTWCRDVTIMELLFATGLRVAELCSLNFDDYNEEDNSFHIIGKGNKERFVYVETQQAQKMFADYLILRGARSTFTSPTSRRRRSWPQSTQGTGCALQGSNCRQHTSTYNHVASTNDNSHYDAGVVVSLVSAI
jgi:integrase/recombinase XerD